MDQLPPQIDKETLKSYHDNKLWRDPDFYVSLLESFAMHPDDYFVRQYIQRLILMRQKDLLAKTFNPDGSVAIKIRPRWSNLWQRLLRYWPTFHGPRIEE